MKKKWLLHMKWSEIPTWYLAVMIWPFLTWILMWPVKAYVGYTAGMVMLGVWIVGTLANIIILGFFSHQYPRKK